MKGACFTWRLLVAVFTGFIFTAYAVKHIPSYAGPYRIIIKQIVDLEKEDAGTKQVWLKAYVQSYRPGHPQYIHGKVVNEVPLGDEYQSTSFMDIRSNNEWKRNSFVMKFPHLCSNLSKYGASEKKIFFATEANICPIPSGERIIKNQTVELNFPDWPTFPYGRWLYRAVVMDKQNNSIGGYALDVETIPKINSSK